ncbi:hypothetical protein [Streptomyces sp. BBFR109]|uniref:hypothetical protein n=1 Tax=Streptomyces sp. BBFR109 TaxID=3448172 RepID=UPI003F777E93
MRGLNADIALGTGTAAVPAVAATSGIPAVPRARGAWAGTAGLGRLIVGVLRRGMAGQWPVIADGAVSALAGGSFIARAGEEADDASRDGPSATS